MTCGSLYFHADTDDARSGGSAEADVFDVDEAVDDGEDGEAGLRVDLEAVGDVAAVGGDGIYRDAEGVGDLFV